MGVSTDDGGHDSGAGLRSFFSFSRKTVEITVFAWALCQL